MDAGTVADTRGGEALIPPPLRWTWRWLMFCVGFAAALSVWWVTWDRFAQQQLQKQVDAILARHEPLLAGDYPVVKTEAERNAAFYLIAADAATSIKQSDLPPMASGLLFGHYPPYPPSWHRQMDACLQANAQVLALLRKASGCEIAQWEAPPGSNQMWVQPPFANMHVAHVMQDAIIDAHLHLDDAEALARAEDLLRMSDAIQEIHSAYADSIAQDTELDAMAGLDTIIPDLEVAATVGPIRTRDGARPAGRAAVERLMAELESAETRAGVGRRAIVTMRVNAYTEYNRTLGEFTVLRPWLALRCAATLRKSEADLDALKAGRLMSDEPPAGDTGAVSMTGLMMASFPFSGAIWAQADVRWLGGVESKRRATVAMLAVRLFWIDHGRWPRELAELVPAYLPGVPDDPEIPNGKIGYVLERGGLPDGGDRPLLFWPEVNSSGKPGLAPSTPVWMGAMHDRPRWYDLARWAPATQPTAGESH